jgi:hypothetical protein
MKKKTTNKVAKAPAAAKEFNINVEYVEAIADESIATIMALRDLVRLLADRLEARK